MSEKKDIRPIVMHLANLVRNKGLVTEREIDEVCDGFDEKTRKKAVRKLKKHKIEFRNGLLQYNKKFVGSDEMIDREFEGYWTKQEFLKNSSEIISIGPRSYEGLVATGFPELTREDWLGKLLGSEDNFDFSIFIEPEQLRKIDLFLENRLKEVEDEIYAYARKNVSNAELEKKKKELAERAEALRKGKYVLYNMRLYLCSKGVNEDKAKETSKKLVSVLHSSGIEGKHATNYQRQLFKSIMPASVDFLRGRKIILPSSTIASAFPFVM